MLKVLNLSSIGPWSLYTRCYMCVFREKFIVSSDFHGRPWPKNKDWELLLWIFNESKRCLGYLNTVEIRENLENVAIGTLIYRHLFGKMQTDINSMVEWRNHKCRLINKKVHFRADQWGKILVLPFTTIYLSLDKLFNFSIL